MRVGLFLYALRVFGSNMAGAVVVSHFIPQNETALRPTEKHPAWALDTKRFLKIIALKRIFSSACEGSKTLF
jgi:hypothetical protein